MTVFSTPEPWTRPDPLPLPMRTERLEVRPFTAEDAPGLLAAMEVDRESLLPWLPWARSENRSLSECVYSIERFRRQHEDPACGEYVFGVFERETGELLGGTGLHDIVPATGQAETGYWMRGDRRNRGYITEAQAALLTAGLTPKDEGGWGFRRMTVRCASDNGASAAVPRKLGLPLEARLRLDRWVDGFGFTDTLGFGVLREEWDFAHKRALPGAAARGLDAGAGLDGSR